MTLHTRLAALFVSGFLILCVVGMLLPETPRQPSAVTHRGSAEAQSHTPQPGAPARFAMAR